MIFCWFNTEKTIERVELRTVTGMIIAVVVSGSEKDYPEEERGKMNNAESLTVRLIIGHCNDGHSSQMY